MENKYPFYKDLKAAYKAGTLKQPKDNVLVYHLNEERAKLGNKYLIWNHWDNFVAGIKLGEEYDNLFIKQVLWGKPTTPNK